MIFEELSIVMHKVKRGDNPLDLHPVVGCVHYDKLHANLSNKKFC